jgi:hypothetical protein
MSDAEYAAARAALEHARQVIADTEDAVLDEAARRGEVYVVRAMRFGYSGTFNFLTVAEAEAFANSDDCAEATIDFPTQSMKSNV